MLATATLQTLRYGASLARAAYLIKVRPARSRCPAQIENRQGQAESAHNRLALL
jgi:hypothetical protein